MDNNCFILPFYTAICMPDVLGKIEFPKPHYARWFDKYVYDDLGISELTGEIMYSIRCGFLHKAEFSRIEMKNTEIIFSLPSKSNNSMNNCAEYVPETGKLLLCIDIVDLCDAIFAQSIKFIQKNIDNPKQKKWFSEIASIAPLDLTMRGFSARGVNTIS